MSEQNENHDQAQAAEALWSRRPAPTAAPSPESPQSPASAPAQPKVPFAQRIKGIHLVFVGAIAGVAYIWGWPWLDNYLNQGQVTPARLQVDSALAQQPPVSMPAAAPMAHPQMASHPAQVASAPAAQTLNPGTGLNSAQPAPTQAPAPTPAAAVADNTAPSAHEQELQDQIKLLKQQLAAASTCSSPHPATAAKQTTAFAAAGAGSNSGNTPRRRHKKPTKHSAATALPSTPAAGQGPVRKTEGRLAGFEVNTVYKDQAYVRHGDSTYIVQVGDMIDGVQILAIDADKRRVITPAGVIEGR